MRDVFSKGSRLLVMAGAATWWGCGTGTIDGGGPELSHQQIVNGETDLGDEAVVLLVDSVDHPSCTGSLVSPRVVLTAAHCVHEGLPARAFFGTSPSQGGTFIDVIAGEEHPGYVPAEFGTNDIAVILLAEDGPAEPVTMNRTPITDADVGAGWRVAGFGRTSAGPDDSGLKRTGTAQLSSYTATGLLLVPDPGNTCRGDSGGPNFLWDGTHEVVAGVTSYGDTDCLVRTGSMRVDAYVDDFIDPYIAANDGGTTPPSCGTDDPPAPTGDPCGGIDYYGVCEGDTLIWCQDDQLQVVPCGIWGATCGWANDWIGNDCL